MQTLLEVVNVIVGSSKAGKTTTLLWLYLKLKEMPQMHVKALSYQDIDCDLTSLVGLIAPEDIILFDLNSFENCKTQDIWNLIIACMNKILVITLSGQVYITSVQGCTKLLESLEKMKKTCHISSI